MLMNEDLEEEKVTENEVESSENSQINSIENKDEKAKVEQETSENSKEQKEDKKVDEATVIEKIKSFIAKIAAMQEEARKENEELKEAKKAQKEEKQAKEEKQKEKKLKTNYLLEYYDLPYRYNETVVKILAQTPKKLFVYWDISDNDREKYLKTFGDDFFEKTYPVLLLYNEDKKYVKEIVINDFANSWYIDIQNPKTKYTIQLGRKFKEYPGFVNFEKVEENKIILKTDYLPFANSNVLEVPNDHVLLESLPRFITFRNVKTNQEFVKDLRSFKDVFGNNYNVNEFYGNEYKEELEEGKLDMSNPSSGVNSSYFK